MTDPDTASQPSAVLLPAEELPFGQDIDCGSYRVTTDNLRDFASEWDPQYFHVDPQRATESEFGGLIASGLHTMSIYQRLVVTALYQRYDVIAGRAFRQVEFLRPVRAGDMLSCVVTVRTVEPERPGRCVVIVDGCLRNQHGKPVLRLELDCLMRSRRPAPSA